MMKKVNIKISILVLLLFLTSVPAYALDSPHNATNNIGCDSCHYTYGSEPSLLIESLSYGLDIDDTQYNALCWSCHNDITAPFVRTHSSLQTDNGYGDWTIECKTCHNPHTQKQVRTYQGTGYLYQATVSAVDATTLTETGAGWTVNAYAGMVLVPNIVNYRNYTYSIISNTADTITVNGPVDLTKVTAGDTFAIAYGKLVNSSVVTPNSGTKTVKLFDSTGTNSFADGDASYDGVCEVCHTQTAYHQNSAAGDHTHNAGLKCSTCHVHTKGFNIQCNICHGFPPTVNTATGGPNGLANNPAATGSATAGAHDEHVNTKGYACTNCHYNSVGTGSTHNDSQTITMGFNMFSGAQQGGSYDGQAGVNYNTTTTSPVTAVSNTGSKGCSTVYCHSTGQSTTDENDSTPTYASPVWDNPSSAACGTCHKVTEASGLTSGSHGQHLGTTGVNGCGDCHTGAQNDASAYNSSNHVNASIDVANTYTAGGTPGNGYGTCSTASCHEDGTGSTVVTPSWGATSACDECHAAAPATGSHTKHLSTTNYNTADCADCHESAVQGTTAPAEHLDGDLDVYDSAAGDLGYPADVAKGGAPYDSCSTAYCHSTGQSTSDGSSSTPTYATVTWGDSAACGTCHKVTEAGGLTSGSHGEHLGSTGVSGCGDCHAGAENDASAYNSVTHVDGTIDVENTYTAGGAPGNGYGTCSTASCHDDTTGTMIASPTWGTDAANCTQCHDASPSTGSHTAHLAASGVACNDCHENAVESTTAPAEHLDSNIDVYDTTAGDLGYPADKAKNSAYTNCTTASCHDDGRGNIVATSVWGTDDANCTQCHAAVPATGSHTKHVTTTNYNTADCADCHKGAVQSTTVPDQHLDTNVDVYTSIAGDLGYPSNKAKGSAYTNCTTAYCHSTGQSTSDGSSSTPTYATVTWGDTAACGTCHKVTEASGLTSGSHGEHLGLTGVNGCADCHTGAANDASAYNSTSHVNASIDVANTYTAGGAPGNGYGTCSTASCHDDGTGNPAVTPVWGTDAANCTQCHAAVPTTGSHTKHLSTTNYNTADCADCHESAVESTTAPAQHRDGNIDVYDTVAGDLGYPQDVTKGGAPYDTCSTAYCHSTGQSTSNKDDATPTYATVTWGDSAACGTCHKVTEASGLTSGSHAEHLGTAGVNGCADCHTGAENDASAYDSINHVNASIDVANSYTAGGAPGNDYGTCAALSCHGGQSPTWGTDFTGIDTCTKCHGTATASPAADYKKAPPTDLNGDTAATDAQVGAHQAHLQSSLSNNVACSECHTVPAAVSDAGHINDVSPGTAELTFGALASSNGASPSYASGECSSVYCHGGALPGGSTDGADETPVWSDTAYLTGSAANDCSRCHGYPPSSLGVHAGKVPTDCITCHDYGINAAGTGFTDASTHINGTVNIGDDCFDCHSSSGGPTPGTTPDEHHGMHIQTPYVGKVSSGDYGNYTTNNWYGYANLGGVPNKKCGYCHPQSSATHMDGNIDLNFDPNDAGAAGTMKAKNNPTQSYTQVEGSSVTCSSVYCHSSGYNDGSGYQYKTSPDWYGGNFVGDKCDDCHGNMPDTSSHMSHGRVAIHYDTIYDGTSGLISGGAASGAGHGDPATSTTINCNLCHNNVVKVAYNDKNTVCAVCHTGTPVGTMVIDPSATSHVTGTADIDFADVIIRSKAQIRDDITTVSELNTYWQRNNGYKAGATSHDSSKATLAATASYSNGTCSTVACHNGIDITWDTNISSCSACHQDVPRTDQ